MGVSHGTQAWGEHSITTSVHFWANLRLVETRVSLKLGGELDYGSVAFLRERLLEFGSQPVEHEAEPAFVLDLQEVGFIDCAAYSTIVAALDVLRQQGVGPVVLSSRAVNRLSQLLEDDRMVRSPSAPVQRRTDN